MIQNKEPTTNGLRLYRAFCDRPLGMLGDEVILGMFALILAGAPHSLKLPLLRDAKDLRTLDIPDDKVEDIEKLLLSLDMGRRPDLATRLVANAARH